MTLDPVPAWEGNWHARIYQQIRCFGCETIQEYLDRFPGVPYSDLAEKLGQDVAAVQLQDLQFKEAQEGGDVRLAAIDGLVRKLREKLPTGWSKQESVRSRAMDAYAVWASMVEVRGGGVKSDMLLPVWRSIEKLAPPEGWLPRDLNDPIIQEAFNQGWPTTKKK